MKAIFPRVRAGTSLLRIPFLAVLLLMGPAVQAGTRTVTTLFDAGVGSLREAIALAANADTINFSAAVTGTITLTSGELLINKSLNITGPGANNLTVARSGVAGMPLFRIFRVASSAANPVSLQLTGLTIKNGSADQIGGGGILFVGFLSGGSPGSALSMEACTLTENVCGGSGGGLLIKEAAVSLRNCAVIDNQTTLQAGGGLSLWHCEAILENCTLYQNKAVDGGAIDLLSTRARLTNCTLAHNPLQHVDDVGASCVKCNNSQGGTVLTLENTVLQRYDNTFRPPNWPAMIIDGAQVISHGYNLCNDFGESRLNGPGDQTDTDAAFVSSPGDHGGPTPTMEFHSGSPALDKGKAFGLATDQRGQARTRDTVTIANAPGGDGTDIGAVEMQEFYQPGPHLVVTTTDDHNDGFTGEYHCTLREAINRANAASSSYPAVITFAPNVTGSIILDPALGALATVTSRIVLAGPGARKLALSGELGVRPLLTFQVFGIESIVSGLTLRDALRPGTSVDGAGLVNLGGFPAEQKALVVTDCAFTGNSAVGFTGSQPGQAGGRARGGAIFNSGFLTLTRCSFIGNAVRGGGGANIATQFGSGGSGGDALGGAVFNDTGGILTASNCSFFTNAAAGGNGGSNPNFGGGNGGHGFGGIHNLGTATLTACTVTLNTATSGAGGTGNNAINNGAPGTAGGGLISGGGTFMLRNTLCAANTGAAAPDVLGAFSSVQGYNLIGKSNGGTGFGAYDQTGTIAAPLDAKLNPLPNHNGATDVFLPLSNSPAVDKGRSFALDTDQRNLPRVRDDAAIANADKGDGTDIGAVELMPAYSGPPKILSITRLGPTVRIVLQGIPFVSYQLQQSSLLSGFTNYGATQTADGIGQTEFTDYGPLAAQRFFRAVQP